MSITNPTEGLKAIQEYLFSGPKLSSGIFEMLRKAVDPTTNVSPLTPVVDVAEMVYARREEIPKELLELGAQLATMCAMHGFYGMNIDGRGYAMAATIRAMPGVESKPPPAAKLEAPEPKAEFLPEEVVNATPPNTP